MMDNPKFKALYEASRKLRESAPEAHARKLAAFAVLGLAYPCAFALLCLALCVGTGVAAFLRSDILLAALAGLFLGFLIRFMSSLHFAMRPPDGILLKKAEAPKLFEEVSNMAKAVGAKTPDAIIIDGSMNAGAACLPGRFPLTPNREFLVLGLPLLAALNMKEFRSTLAHELGHFSLEHPASDRLAWRALLTWLRISSMLRAIGGFLSNAMLGAFANWYLPRLDALRSVNSKMNEFGADAKAVSIAGRDASARALAIYSLRSRKLSFDIAAKFWEKARKEPEPPPGFFKSVVDSFRAGRPSQAELAVFFENARKTKSLDGDTHPSAGERLAKMGFESSLPQEEENGSDALKTLLGDSEAPLAAKLDERWRKDIQPLWSAVNADAQLARQELSSMLNVSMKEAQSQEFKLRRTRLLETAFGPSDAKAPLEDLLAEFPDSAETKFNLGRIKLSLGEPEGADLMRAAMDANPVFIPAGFEALSTFYRAEGMADEHASLLLMLEKAPAALPSRKDGSLKKPSTPVADAKWKVSPPTLAGKEIEELRRVLEENGNVEKAYLVKAEEPEKPGAASFHALVVVRKFSLLAYRGENDSALAEELAKELSKKLGGLRVVPFDASPALFRLKVKMLKGSLAYKS